MNWTVDFLDEAEKDMKRLDPSVRVGLGHFRRWRKTPFPPTRLRQGTGKSGLTIFAKFGANFVPEWVI